MSEIKLEDQPNASMETDAEKEDVKQPRMKKNDSGIAEETAETSNGFIAEGNDARSKNSPDSGHHEGELELSEEDTGQAEAATGSSDRKRCRDETPMESDSSSNDELYVLRQTRRVPWGKTSRRVMSSDDDDEDADDEGGRAQPNFDFEDKVSSTEGEETDLEKSKYQVVKTKPKYGWFLTQEIVQRQYGMRPHYNSADLFRQRAAGSLHMVERLELMYKMKEHVGCVNALHFNTSGTRLASGSDDLAVVIWDWTVSERVVSFESGHKSNVFQVKFMPLTGDCHVVTCARDGQVRLAELSATNVCKSTRKLAQHRNSAHKLALESDCPHCLLSCGEDGVVFEIDLRESRPVKLVTCKENDDRVSLYAIHSNPRSSYEFAVGGRDQYARIYDKRKISEDGSAMIKYCPHHLINGSIRANVTCLVYNYNGKELLTSYNDEDIYTFDTSHSDGADSTHCYRGHRNNATVKGVNYFGPQSEFIVSGSDCGNIYMWDHDTEAIVQGMAGDEGGVVNCLEPHPTLPILATSGLDDDIKIWVPSCEHPPDLTELYNTMRCNLRDREEENHRDPDPSEHQMLLFLMHHLRRTARRRARMHSSNAEGTSSEDMDETDSDDSDDTQQTVQCPTS